MKTQNYNPSRLEIDVIKAIVALQAEIEAKLPGSEILQIHPDYTSDNPYLVIRTKDEDGDVHELVMQVIQRPDGLVK